MMNDIAKFYSLVKTVEENEEVKANAKKALKEAYAELVLICPHSEAIDYNYSKGNGDYRVCMICGLEDLASEGGTPGDEYNYGYPGSPNRDFWKDANIRRAKNEKEHWKYRRGHYWRVRDGKVVDSLA
jgi:hypothetical protein